MLNVLIIKEIVDKITVLDDFLRECKKTSATLQSNGYKVPVPEHLIKKWYADLKDHRDKLVKELIDATK